MTLSAKYDKPATFKLSDARSWPSLYKLWLILALCPTLHLCLLIKISSFFCVFASSVLVLIILIKLQVILNDRREYHKIFDKGNVPSVPNKHLLSGNLFEMIVARDNILVMQRYHKKLGKTYGMFYGPDPWIQTTDLDLLQKIFVKEKLINRTLFRTPFPAEFGDSLVQIQGEKWRKTRRVLNAPFTSHQMQVDNVFGDIEEVVDRMMVCFNKHPLESTQSSSERGRIVDINSNFKKFTAEVIFQVAYGRRNGINLEPEGQDILLDAIDGGSKAVRNPIVWASIMLDDSSDYLQHLIRLTPLQKFLSIVHSVLNESLRARRDPKLREELKKNSGLVKRRMLDSLIDCVEENKLSDHELRSNLFFMFCAGFETTANTLTMLFWELARNQKIQDKLREEVLRDADKAGYLAWCIQETMRLYPAVPSSVGRVLPETIHFNGQTLFKGTTVIANIYSIHRCADIWGADADEFKPERWAQANQMHPMQFFTFGHGSRRCLGGSMAMAEMNAIVPRILLRYRIDRCPNTPEVMSMEAPNLIHYIIDGRVDVRFTEISSL